MLEPRHDDTLGKKKTTKGWLTKRRRNEILSAWYKKCQNNH
jgi:hypothetical protein